MAEQKMHKRVRRRVRDAWAMWWETRYLIYSEAKCQQRPEPRRLTDRWSKVTCKRCLKMNPKGGA